MLLMEDSESEITTSLVYEGGGGTVFGSVVEPGEWLLTRRNISTCEGEECVVASLRSVVVYVECCCAVGVGFGIVREYVK